MLGVFAQRTVADLEEIITVRFQHRENALIVECDALRAELVEAHNRIESVSQSASEKGAYATQIAAAEISIEEMRAERDAALRELSDLRVQVKKQSESSQNHQNSSSSGSSSRSAGGVGFLEHRPKSPEQQPHEPG